jgi:hypothetical protein
MHRGRYSVSGNTALEVAIGLPGEEQFMSMSKCLAAAFVLAAVAVPASAQTVVFETGANNGFTSDFTSATFPGTRIGDSGWFGFGSDAPVLVTKITIGLAASSFSGTAAGSTDIKVTLNNGDPSGLVFGSGAALYTTTLTNVSLPALIPGDVAYFDIEIPVPSVATLGGFNNVGFSVEPQGFSYGGALGMQTTGTPNNLGFFTNVASQFNPPGSGQFFLGWYTYNFGGPANYRFIVEIPEPSMLAPLGMLALAGLRRRR